jgi:hypothetical protein
VAHAPPLRAYPPTQLVAVVAEVQSPAFAPHLLGIPIISEPEVAVGV